MFVIIFAMQLIIESIQLNKETLFVNIASMQLRIVAMFVNKMRLNVWKSGEICSKMQSNGIIS